MSKKYCLCGHTAATHSKMGTGICWVPKCKCSGFVLNNATLMDSLKKETIDKINRFYGISTSAPIVTDNDDPDEG